MNKFEKTLSGNSKDVLGDRSKNLSNSVISEMDAIVIDLKRRKNNLETEVVNLTDLAPENSYSLRPGTANFSAKEWASKMQATKLSIAQVDVELAVANSIIEEWFTSSKK